MNAKFRVVAKQRADGRKHQAKGKMRATKDREHLIAGMGKSCEAKI